MRGAVNGRSGEGVGAPGDVHVSLDGEQERLSVDRAGAARSGHVAAILAANISFTTAIPPVWLVAGSPSGGIGLSGSPPGISAKTRASLRGRDARLDVAPVKSAVNRLCIGNAELSSDR